MSDDPDASGPSGAQERIPVAKAALAFRTARKHGLIDESDTSVIFHDLARMHHRLESVLHSFPESALHALAIKANPLIGVLKRAVEAGAGLEAASFEELELALRAGCPADRIVFDSPAKTRAELEAALALNVRINANSIEELERIAVLSSKHQPGVVGVRINPGVGPGRIQATSVAAAESKFGVDIEEQARVIQAFERYGWLRSLHVHVGSQGCDIDQLVEAGRTACELRRRIHARLHTSRIDSIDIGGGLPADYGPETDVLTPADYAALLRQHVPDLFEPGLSIVTEFGRSIQAGAGFAIARVEYTKRTSQARIAIIHLGADFLLRPVYRPDDWQHEYAVLDSTGQPKRAPQQAWTLAGPLCFSDVFARRIPLPEIEEGDYILIRDAGAYTLGLWSRHCSRAMPCALGFDDAGSPETFQQLRAREKVSDLVALWGGSKTAAGLTSPS